MGDWQLKPLSEEQLRSFRARDQDGPLTWAEKFSLFAAKTPVSILEEKAAEIFELPECDSFDFVCDFVADEIGIASDRLRPQEILLAVHYIYTFGGGYNSKAKRLVF